MNKNCIVSAFCTNENKLIVGNLNGDVYLTKSDFNKNSILHFNTQNPVKQILNINENQILISNRQCDYISLWDIRNLNNSISSFYRKNSTNQQLEMSLYANKYLATAASDGTIIVYNIHDLTTKYYFYENMNNESVSSAFFLTDLNNMGYAKLLTSNGERRYKFNYLKNYDSSLENSMIKEDLSQQVENDENCIKIWKLKL